MRLEKKYAEEAKIWTGKIIAASGEILDSISTKSESSIDKWYDSVVAAQHKMASMARKPAEYAEPTKPTT